MAGLGDPVVRAAAQRTHAVCDLGGLTDDQDCEPGQRVADALDVVEPAESRVHDDGVQPHAGKLVRARRVRQRLGIPAHRLEAALKHRDKAAVVIDKCDPYLPSLGGH